MLVVKLCEKSRRRCSVALPNAQRYLSAHLDLCRVAKFTLRALLQSLFALFRKTCSRTFVCERVHRHLLGGGDVALHDVLTWLAHQIQPPDDRRDDPVAGVVLWQLSEHAGCQLRDMRG